MKTTLQINELAYVRKEHGSTHTLELSSRTHVQVYESTNILFKSLPRVVKLCIR